MQLTYYRVYSHSVQMAVSRATGHSPRGRLAMTVWFSRALKSRLFPPIFNRTLSTWNRPFRPTPRGRSTTVTPHDIPLSANKRTYLVMPSETAHRHWKDGLPIKVSHQPSFLTSFSHIAILRHSLLHYAPHSLHERRRINDQRTCVAR